MSEFLTDNFTDSNGTAITSHTPDSGGSWAKGSDFSSGTGEIQNNRALGTAGNFCAFLYSVASPGTAGQQVVTAVIRLVSVEGTGCGPLACATDSSGSTGYIAFLEPDGTLLLFRNFGVATVGSAGSLSVGNDYTVVLDTQTNPGHILINVNGVNKIDYLDGSPLDGTKVGMYFNDSGTSSAGMHIDSITAEDDYAPSLASGAASLSSATGSTVTVTIANATGGTGPYTYQWYFDTTSGFTPGAGNIISGATTQTYAHTGRSSRTRYYYKCIVTDDAAATVTSNQVGSIIWDTNLSIGSATYSMLIAALQSGALKVGFIGDSITYGQGLSDATTQAPPVIFGNDIVAAIPGCSSSVIRNQGQSGATTYAWTSGSGTGYLSDAETDFSSNGVNVVMIMLGANDAATSNHVDADTYSTRLSSIVSQLTGDGYKVVINYPTYIPSGANGGATDETSVDLTTQYFTKIDALVDNVDVFAGDTGNAWAYFCLNQATAVQSDKTHPNQTGAAVLGDLWIPSVPAAPSDLTATAISSSRIDLAWTGDYTGIFVQRSLDGSSWTTIYNDDIWTGGNNFHATGLNSSTTYYFRMKGSTETGTSGYSATVNATTSMADFISKSLARTSAGLLLKDDFSDLSSWTLGSAIAQETAPSFVVFDRSPISLLDPGATTDAGGVREGFWFIDTDGTWYIFYGAGDGSGGAGGPWRIQCASTTDKGLNWTRHGETNFGLQKTSNVGDGYYAARDMLRIEKVGSTYYLYAMTATSTIANQVPGGDYSTDLWSSTSPLGPWTFVRQYLALGSGGSDIDHTEAVSGSLVTSSGVSYEFFSAAGTHGQFCSLATSATADRTGSDLVKSGIFVPPRYLQIPTGKTGAENPKVFYNSVLGKWMMLMNIIGPTGTDITRLFGSSSVSNWTGATVTDLQRISPAAGTNAVGIMSPLYNPDGTAISESDGTTAVTYDTDGSGHTDRSLRYAELVPSVDALLASRGTTVFGPDAFTHANGTLAGYNGWTVTAGSVNIASNQVDMGSSPGETIAMQAGLSIQNPTVKVDFTLGVGCSIAIIFRYQNSSNFYFLDCNRFGDDSANIVLYKRVSGSDSSVASAGNDIPLSAQTTFELSVTGNTFTLFANGVSCAIFTDSTFTAAGAIGMRNGNGGTGNRLADNFSVWDNDLAVVRRATRTLSNDDFIMEFGLEYPSVPSGKVGIEYRRTDDNNHYRALISAQGIWQLYKVVSGTATSIGSFSGSVIANSGTIPCKVVISGTTHKFYLAGELQGTVTDSTYSSGTSIALVATNSCNVRFRALVIYASDTVTVNGLIAGQVVTLRGAGDQPLATAVASDVSQTFTVPHYGARSLTVDSRLFSLSGRSEIWGGDELDFETISSSDNNINSIPGIALEHLQHLNLW